MTQLDLLIWNVILLADNVDVNPTLLDVDVTNVLLELMSLAPMDVNVSVLFVFLFYKKTEVEFIIKIIAL